MYTCYTFSVELSSPDGRNRTRVYLASLSTVDKTEGIRPVVRSFQVLDPRGSGSRGCDKKHCGQINMLRSLLKSVSTAQYGHSGVLGLLYLAAARSASWIAAPTRNSYPVLSCIVFLSDRILVHRYQLVKLAAASALPCVTAEIAPASCLVEKLRSC